MKNIILSFILLSGILLSGYSQNKGIVKPLNPAYIKYMEDLKSGKINNQTKDGHMLGLIPSPVKPDFTNYFKSKKNQEKKSFPASYDLRKLALVTTVKDQGQCGSCWTFATMGSIESTWLKLGLGTNNLSENNLKDCHHFNIDPCSGGMIAFSMAYLSRRDGPLKETDDPYVQVSQSCLFGKTPVSYVTDARVLPNDRDALKQALLDYGALYTSFYYDQFGGTYNGSNYTYYYPDSMEANHGVVIVGWDDNKQTAASNPGAWIIKNSWGTGWGESGYFYISYYDKTILAENGCFPSRIAYKSNARLYHYDDLGWIEDYGYDSDIAYGLVKFTNSDNSPLLKVATFINSSNAMVDFDIYSNFDGTNLSGLLGYLHGQKCPYPGYYTFDLPEPITLIRGNNFYIQVKYSTPDNNSPIPCEGSDDHGYASPDIETGKCWTSSDGKSWDAIGANTSVHYDLCIRGYADPNCNPPVATITPTDSVNICQGETATFSANSGTNITYQWQKDGIDIPGATNISYTAKESGNFSVVVMDSKKCENSSRPVFVEVYTIDAGANQNITCNASVQLNPDVKYSGGTTGDFVQLYNPLSVRYTDVVLAEFGADIKSNCVSGSLAYVKDEGSSYLGCNGYASNALKDKIALVDRGTCEFGFKSLKAQQAGALAVVIVNTGQNSIYDMMGTGSSGGQVTVPVVMLSKSEGAYLKKILADSGYANVAIGCDPGEVKVKWSPADGLSKTDVVNPVASPKATTTYTLTVTTKNCTVSDKITITVTNAPEVKVGKDTIVVKGKSITLNAGSGGTSYLWSDGSKNQTLTINTTNMSYGVYPYSVTVTNSSGCEGIDTINVTVADHYSVGIDAISGKDKIRVYPNPFTSDIRIQCPMVSKQLLIFRMYDFTGKLIMEKKIEETTETKISTGFLNNGLYLYTLVNQNRILQKGVLIKQ